MTIRITAECDGPSCDVRETAQSVDDYPHPWIVIKLIRARDGLNHTAQREYGFHRRECLIAWVANGQPEAKQ